MFNLPERVKQKSNKNSKYWITSEEYRDIKVYESFELRKNLSGNDLVKNKACSLKKMLQWIFKYGKTK